ncbi:(Na+)-NQR maturation NqrM [Halobacteriovorax sp. GFR7]|uniref:(Na+)-NQR maturation NqrM n=1 Tax=unclassified Halobacteriovorax TaxID=2639665 RepID=UPI003715DFFC
MDANIKLFLITFAVLALSITGMAVGVILSNRKLQGSCGGLGKLIGEDCQFCDKKDECTDNPEQAEDCLKA